MFRVCRVKIKWLFYIKASALRVHWTDCMPRGTLLRFALTLCLHARLFMHQLGGALDIQWMSVQHRPKRSEEGFIYVAAITK